MTHNAKPDEGYTQGFGEGYDEGYGEGFLDGRRHGWAEWQKRPAQVIGGSSARKKGQSNEPTHGAPE